MKTIKERIWEKATTELNFQDTERNFEYEEPIIDLTLKEVLELLNTFQFANNCIDDENKRNELKQHITEGSKE